MRRSTAIRTVPLFLLAIPVGLATPTRLPAVSAAPQAVPFTRITTGDAVTGARSSPSASWVDIDADGDEDLYVLNGFGSLEEEPVPQENDLYLNDGRGGFSRVPGHPLVEDVAFSGSAVWGDYDGDGDLDVFVANQRGADNFLFRNEGGGSFTRVAEGPPVSDGGRSFSAAWVDIDGDGDLDLHVANGRDGDGGEVDFVYRNLGPDGFERVEDVPFAREALPSGGAAWADWDGDGDADLFLPVNSASASNRLYRNDGEWRFEEIGAAAGLDHEPLPYSPRVSAAHWVDWDADGDLDLHVGNVGTIDFLYANDGRGKLERVTAGRLGLDATYVSDTEWADLDNDGYLDLVVAVWGGASELWLNDGQGGLRRVDGGDLGAGVDFASSVSTSDIDADGDLDLYLTQWPINEAGGLPNRLYRNDGAAGNWLAIDLETSGTAVGALVTVSARIGGDTRRQLRHLASRTSWRSSSSRTLHFGLGAADAVDRIEVRWPSGRTQVLEGPIAPNRTLQIVERGSRPPAP